MRNAVIAIALLTLTAGAVVLYPGHRTLGAVDPIPIQPPPVDPLTNERPRVEVVFVLDTTGSMSGLIQAAKDKIWSIASTMAAARPAPEIRMGLVAYRDRGDAYVTQVIDLSSDLDSVYARLMDFQAAGGGDGPESVNQGLHDAVHRIAWSQDPDAYRVVFLVGDAPPHMDYQDDVKYPEVVSAARQKGILVNTIQCGSQSATAREWRRIAALGDGRYFQVDQAGGAVAVASPFDRELAELSAELDGTRLYYGSEAERAKKQLKLEAADKLHAVSSVESRARRAVFNASESGEKNLLGDGELVDDLVAGRVDLDSIGSDELPEPLQGLPREEQEAVVAETAARRDELKDRIEDLARQRASYVAKEVEERGGAEESLDHKVFGAVREQAAKAGLRYEAAAPAY
ncbi:MAG: VWA domain-containing protein [Chromatiales bacterium]|jgi:Mg-chelatase subunit ChlD